MLGLNKVIGSYWKMRERQKAGKYLSEIDNKYIQKVEAYFGGEVPDYSGEKLSEVDKEFSQQWKELLKPLIEQLDEDLKNL